MNTPVNSAALMRSLVIYAIVVPLAVVVGYFVTNPLDYSFFGFFGILALLLVSPVLLRWHYPLLLLSWNLGAGVFFIKGSPSLWLVMVAVSLCISVLERALDSQKRFLYVPRITWSLLCLTGVVILTAKLTGGIGLHVLGSDVYGGKKYVVMLAGILSYFALTAKRIPTERAWLYVGLFFLGGLACAISDLFPLAPSWAHPIFWVFAPTIYNYYSDFAFGETRLAGVSSAGFMLWCFLMARYGVRGVFLSGKVWRLIFFFAALFMVFMGGFRSKFVIVGLIFTLQFFLEGLHRTRLLPIFAFVGVFAAAAVIPLASRLPLPIQRTLAILPLHLDPQARIDAQASLDWRLEMWRALLPQVPQHLILGKGFAIAPEDYNEMMGTQLGAATGQIDPSQNPLALSSDFHSGPLSVLIPFGIWGAITMLWLLGAGVWVLQRNFRHGDPALRSINLFLLAAFVTEILNFTLIGGFIQADIAQFVGYLGLSISLNGGVCQRPAAAPAPAEEPFRHPQGVMPPTPPRPAFSRG